MAVIFPTLESTAFPTEESKPVKLKDGSWITIREARPEDALLLPMYLDAFSDEDLRQRFFAFADCGTFCKERAGHFYRDALHNPRGQMLVAIGDTGQLEGVARAMFLHEEGVPTYEISFSARKKENGVGSALMTELVRWAQQPRKKRSRFIAATLRSNEHMFHLLARFGFREVVSVGNPEIVEFVRLI